MYADGKKDTIDISIDYLINDIKNKNILEVGSCSENGQLRKGIMKYNPKTYIGIDLSLGMNVDMICSAEDICLHFRPDTFDMIISVVVFEHIYGWKQAIHNIKTVCKSNGIIFLAVPYLCFYHGSPKDYWRYSIDDINNIFSDCDIELLEKEIKRPGIEMIYTKVKKPVNFKENDLINYKLTSIITGNKE